MTADVIILGGGCGGLWLLYELSRSGYRVLLLDGNRLGSFASTRNQSWLHSGALYAMLESPRVARQCVRGSDLIRTFCTENCPEAIADDARCLFLFDREDDAEKVAEEVHAAGIEAEVLTGRQVEGKEPSLRPNRSLRSALYTQDQPFDSYQILLALASLACAQGAGFQVANLATLDISRPNGVWRIRDGNDTFEAPIVVSAAGALNPFILERLAGHTASLSLQKCHVAVIHYRPCRNILVFRNGVANALNIVPFDGGITVNFGYRDEQTTDPFDLFANSKPFEDLGRMLKQWMPRAFHILSGTSCSAHLYACQKVNNTDGENNPFPKRLYGARHHFWLEELENFFIFYPGKFTLAACAAIELTAVLSSTLGSPRSAVVSARAEMPTIARRPYYGSANYVLKGSGDTLMLVPMVG